MPRKRFLPETRFDRIQHVRLRGIGLIKNILSQTKKKKLLLHQHTHRGAKKTRLEREIRGSKAIAEMLREYPTRVRVRGFLHRVPTRGSRRRGAVLLLGEAMPEERVVRDDPEERGFSLLAV